MTSPRQEAAEAKEKPLGLKVSKPKNGCITAVKGAGFFCDYVAQDVPRPTRSSARPARPGPRLWNQGGLTIRTTLDPQSQKSVAGVDQGARLQVRTRWRRRSRMVEPGTGKILGMGQSRPYGFGKNETADQPTPSDNDMGGGTSASSPVRRSSRSWRRRPWRRARPATRSTRRRTRWSTRARSRRAAASPGRTRQTRRSRTRTSRRSARTDCSEAIAQVGQHLLRRR